MRNHERTEKRERKMRIPRIQTQTQKHSFTQTRKANKTYPTQRGTEERRTKLKEAQKLEK